MLHDKQLSVAFIHLQVNQDTIFVKYTYPHVTDEDSRFMKPVNLSYDCTIYFPKSWDFPDTDKWFLAHDGFAWIDSHVDMRDGQLYFDIRYLNNIQLLYNL